MLVETETKSIDMATSVLIALTEMRREAGATELARALGLHPAAVSRLLSGLEAHGLVEQHLPGRYRLGSAIVRLGGRAEIANDLRWAAVPELESLARDVHETVTLEILEGDGIITLAYSDATGIGGERIYRNSPLHATAPGKVLLAHRPEYEVIRLVKSRTSPESALEKVRLGVLMNELARVRRHGFSIALGQGEPPASSIAVPVHDREAAVVAALQLRGPGSRFTAVRVPDLVSRAQVAAAAITSRIGGVEAFL